MMTAETHIGFESRILPPISDILRDVPRKPNFLYEREAARARCPGHIPGSLMPIDGHNQGAGHVTSQRMTTWREKDLPDESSDVSVISSSSSLERSTSIGYTNTAPPSAYSCPTLGEFDGLPVLQDLLEQVEPDWNAVRQCILEILDDRVKPAHNQGWYRPLSEDNSFSAELEPWIRGKNMDELVDTYYTRDATRATYGERVTIPRKANDVKTQSKDISRGLPRGSDGDKSLVSEVGGDLGMKREKTHAEKEQERRTHHRELQMEADLRSPDVVVVCGIEHADRMKDTNTQRAKGPGKYEQLCMAILSLELGARVVQSEHNGRKKAEAVVRLLLEYFLRQQTSIPRGRQIQLHGGDTGALPRDQGVARHGTKRGQRDVDDEKVYSWRDRNVESDSDSSSGSRKRYKSVHHSHTSRSTIQSLPPSPAPSSEFMQPPMMRGGSYTHHMKVGNYQ